MTQQITDTLMMIRPVAFHLNEQTAVNNYYQRHLKGLNQEEVQQRALNEFDTFVQKLRANDIKVLVFDDTAEPETPDSIFPNNWVSFHDNGQVMLYPMYAENRRSERRDDLLSDLAKDFEITQTDSFATWEAENKFLEGTGSLILDRQNKIVYAALSERTNKEVLRDFTSKTGYKAVVFNAYQSVNGLRLPIYHTNVMMCLGDAFVVICADSIDDQKERDMVLKSFEESNKKLILITEEQKERFAGNMLQVKNSKKEKFVVMSESAYKSLGQTQKTELEKHGNLLFSSLNTIEALGGGSARCMMAEVFLPKK